MTLPVIDKNKFIGRIIKTQSKDRLEEFRQYSSEIESKFDSDKKKLANSYQEAIKDLSADELGEVEDYFSDDYYVIEQIHIGIYRNSTLVSIYSFLETSMNNLCKHLYRMNNYPVKLDDIKGEGIIRANIYLEKLAKADFSKINAEWSNLVTLNKIRNCIVHCEGNIQLSKNPDALRKIITNVKGVSLRNDMFLVVDREYIDSSISIIEAFLDKLYGQILS